MSQELKSNSLVNPMSYNGNKKPLVLVDTSNLEFEYVIIEPNGYGSEARYNGFYGAAHELLNMPIIGEILTKAINEDLGRRAMNDQAVNDWLYSNAEEVAAEHGYIMKREIKS